MPAQCDMREDNGEQCTRPSTHLWGKTNCCCPHYDRLASLLLEISQLVAERRHAELLALYENYAVQISNLTGIPLGKAEKAT